MSKKQDSFYFDNFLACADYACQASHLLDQALRAYDPAQIKERMAALNPILMEMLPLSLEEIFIYELGGEDYAVRDIVL